MPPSSELKRCQKERGAASRPVVALSLALVLAGDGLLAAIKPMPVLASVHLLRRALGKESSGSNKDRNWNHYN
jgi:hypothetical protein